jgi:hypothetical protein
MIPTRRTLTASLLLVATAAALLAAPAVSGAAKAPPGPIVSSRATGEISGPPGTTAKVTARCPRGTKVISGGVKTYANIQLEGDARVMVPYVSRRKGRRAWTVSVYNAAMPIVNPKRFAAIAYCRKGAGRIVSRMRRGAARTLGSGGGFPFPFRHVFAQCPYNKWPVAGGFAMQLSPADLALLAGGGGPPGLVFGSRIVPGGWEGTFGRFSPGTTVVRTFAYCGKRPVKVRARARYVTGLGQMTHFATPFCPRRTRAVSAGYYAPFIFRSETDISAVIPLEQRRLNPKRWMIGAVPLTPYPSRTTAYSYCS